MPLAAVMPAPHRPLEIREFSPPELEPGGVLLDTIYSEVCGTDVHLWEGRLAGVPYPIIPGHVSVGVVRAVRGLVSDVDGHPIREGDQVTFLDVHETCNRCWYCLVAHQTTRCPARKVYGITYSAEQGLLGGWSQQIYLKPGVHMIRLPQDLSSERLIAGGCALPTSLHALDRAQIRLGDHVAIQGSGPVGICLARLARLSGAAQVIIIDRWPMRLDMARRMGADADVLLDSQGGATAAARVRELTSGRGADVTIEATGAPDALPDGLEMTRDGGRYVVVGHYTDGGEVLINPHRHINRKHLEIRGCWGSDFSHFYRMVQVLRLATPPGCVPWEELVTRTVGLHDVQAALDDVRQGRIVKARVDPHRL